MPPTKKKMSKPENNCGAATNFLLGRIVQKEFKNFGLFTGHVTDFHVDTGYRVDYEDGDSEDFTEADLLKLLAHGPANPLSAFELLSQLSKRSQPPATTLQQYIGAARTSARRKRKHTVLKRSGILERKRQEAEAALIAAQQAAERTPLHPPPAWAAGLDREGRIVKVDAPPAAEATESAQLHDHDVSLFRLRLSATGPTTLEVQWWFPPANPGSAGAWLGLFPADHVEWGADGSPHGEVSAGANRILFKMLTRDSTSGVMKFSGIGSPKVKDGLYVFTLQSDYGRQAKAVSERFKITGGRVVAIYEGALCSDFPEVNRKHRQQNASLNLFESVSRSVDKDAELEDARCYFPVTHVDVTCPRAHRETIPYLSRVYHVVDKASFLDWGLTSDYQTTEVEGGGRGLRDRSTVNTASAPSTDAPTLQSTQYSAHLSSAAQHATRRANIDGSEGYGEATIGSAHKVGFVLTKLRDLVLHDLHDAHWGLLWDLGQHSTFLDIGSGYGKVVLHLRLMGRMRRSVGMEYVKSRDDIAKQALFSLEAEVGVAAGRQAIADASSVGADAAAPDAASPASGAGSSTEDLADSDVAMADAGMADAGNTSDEAAASLPMVPRYVKSGPFDGVEFECGDATKFASLQYTHIYIFDWVFAKSTLRDLAKVLQRSPFYVLCSFRKVTEWWSYGLVKIQPVAKLPFKTTGNEGMTCYIYANVEKMPNVTPA